MEPIKTLVRAECERLLGELESCKDVVYHFPTQNPMPQVHWFEMRKMGKGWHTEIHLQCSGIVECPVASSMYDNDDGDVATKYRSLSSLKKQWTANGELFHCVVHGHFTAPATIYQLVIENLNESTKKDLVAFIKQTPVGMTHDYHLELPWVSDIPSVLYDEWEAY
jgi:hypothetical protein